MAGPQTRRRNVASSQNSPLSLFLSLFLLSSSFFPLSSALLPVRLVSISLSLSLQCTCITLLSFSCLSRPPIFFFFSLLLPLSSLPPLSIFLCPLSALQKSHCVLLQVSGDSSAAAVSSLLAQVDSLQNEIQRKVIRDTSNLQPQPLCIYYFEIIMPLTFCGVCLSSYHSALSEMAVHAYCKGAVMILGKPDNNQSQVSSHVQ